MKTQPLTHFKSCVTNTCERYLKQDLLQLLFYVYTCDSKILFEFHVGILVMALDETLGEALRNLPERRRKLIAAKQQVLHRCCGDTNGSCCSSNDQNQIDLEAIKDMARKLFDYYHDCDSTKLDY